MLNDAALSGLLFRIENLFDGQPTSQKPFSHPTSNSVLSDLDLSNDVTDELDRYLTIPEHLSDSSHTSSPSAPPSSSSFQFNQNVSSHFEFMLDALTTSTGRMNEETTTYLNQGQPYEIKFRTNDSLPTTYRSMLRLCFWDKVLQNQEYDLMQKWLKEYNSTSLFDIDMNSTYGILSIIQSRQIPNAVEIVWDPSTTTSLFLRFKCTSTDFAQKRHGGEKGIPLRLQIDTYYENDVDDIKHVHSCCCKIQLFRLKGAQRKIKADQIRIDKSKSDQRRRFEAIYKYIILQSCPASPLYTSNLLSLSYPPDDLSNVYATDEQNGQKKRNLSLGFLSASLPDTKFVCAGEQNHNGSEQRNPITIQSTNEDVLKWLNENHFSSVLNRFEFYTGTDVLRLTFDDLRRLCNDDHSISIRLYNQLNQTIVTPLKTFFIKLSVNEHFSVIYLHTLTREELLENLFQLIQQPKQDSWSLVLELSKIRIRIDHDNVVKYSLPDQGQFYLKIASRELALCLLNSIT